MNGTAELRDTIINCFKEQKIKEGVAVVPINGFNFSAADIAWTENGVCETYRIAVVKHATDNA